MGVSYIVAIDLSGIVFDSLFGDGVVNESAAVFVFGQVSKAPCPLIVGSDNLAVNLLTVCQQVDSDGCRTFAILVVFVIPGLNAFYSNQLGSVGVGYSNGKTLGIDICLITLGNIQLRHGVDVILTFGSGNQIIFSAIPDVGPSVVIAQHNGIANVAVAFLQLNGEGIGADAVLIVIVFPNFSDADIGTGEFRGNTGNGELVLFAIHVQISPAVGGIVSTLLKIFKLRIDGNVVS